MLSRAECPERGPIVKNCFRMVGYKNDHLKTRCPDLYLLHVDSADHAHRNDSMGCAGQGRRRDIHEMGPVRDPLRHCVAHLIQFSLALRFRMGGNQGSTVEVANGFNYYKYESYKMTWRGVLLSLTYLFVGFLLGCNVCADQVVSQADSPDAVLAITSFVRNCGATTDYSSMVSVHRKSEGFRDEQDVVFVAKGRHDLSIKWTRPRALLIACSSCKRKQIFRQVTALGDIDVAYQLDPH